MSTMQVDDAEVDQYGNPTSGNSLPYCCFPDCGCEGVRLCSAQSGASNSALSLNFEHGTLTLTIP